LDPFPQVSSGQVLGETTLTNPGDVEAWPTWTITGPASLVTITHLDTGEEFAVDPGADGIDHGPLLEGEQVVVTTDPPRVRGPEGGTRPGALARGGAGLRSLGRAVARAGCRRAAAGGGSRVGAPVTRRDGWA